jgi:hypothetical protein
MKKITFIAVTMVMLFTASSSFSQTLVINEVITSNANVITDDDDSYEDWVEIYFNGPEAINLEGYGLSDDPTLPHKWVFPEYWIEPGDHLLIWCSDKNRTNIDFPLHTNFKISSSGEVITLTDNNSVTVDSYPAVVIPQNYSYGRQTDGASSFVIFAEPTPGEANTTQGYSEILSPPTLSMNGGFYTNPFNVNISHPDPNVTIIYTLDGSDPDINNLLGTSYQYKNSYREFPGQTDGTLLQNSFKSFQYSTAIAITDRTSQPNDISMISSTYNHTPDYIPNYNLFKGTVLRARAFKTGAMPSKTTTKTYFVTPEGAAKFSLPVVSISVTENKFFDYNNGIYVAGVDYDNWRNENPTAEAMWEAIGNFTRSGDETEQIGNINYFVNGNEVLNQDLGLRINGGVTREFKNKSLRLYARSEYGNSTFNYPIFADESFSNYKRLVLRNSGQDFDNTMFKDAFTQDLVRNLSPDTKAYQPTIVFLNGEYWGILNLRERYDKQYFEQVYNINEEDLDFLKDDLAADEGSNEDYLDMLDYMRANNLNNPSNYNYINTLIDVDNFKDYFITNIYIQNTDWPGWNTVFWRKRTAAFQPNAPFGQDGRWRAAMNDTDAGFSLGLDISNHNTLEFATATDGPEWPNPEWSTVVLRKLLENDGFKLEFINRFADLLNTYFLPTRVIGKSNQFKARIQPEMSEVITRWKSPSDYDWWEESINVIQRFANVRPGYQREHIRGKFGISGDINATLNVDNQAHGYIKMNTIDINSNTPGVTENPYPWTGIYFQNIPVTLKAVALPGYQFSHWSGASTSTESTITITTGSDFSITAHFIPSETEETEEPIYFWVFDSSITNDAPLTSLNATFEVPSDAVLEYQSCLIGYPFESTHPNWRKASMERRNSPTDINYIPEANNNVPFASVNMRGIQIKQPFENNGNQNAMIFSLPTTGFKDIVFAFAAKDELAADGIVIDYSTTSGAPTWTTTGLTASTLPLTSAYQLFNVDFSTIEAADNNATFKVRLRFSGTNLTEDLGNRVTFNNFSTQGIALNMAVDPFTKPLFTLFPNPVTDVLHIVHTATDVSYKIFSVDGKLIQSGDLINTSIPVNTLQKGIYLVEITADGSSQVQKFIKK